MKRLLRLLLGGLEIITFIACAKVQQQFQETEEYAEVVDTVEIDSVIDLEHSILDVNREPQNENYWVDMGVTDKDGRSVFWAKGNLCRTYDGRYYLTNSNEMGTYFVWGDVTGIAENSFHLQDANLNEISGNPQYDIANAVDSRMRLPTADEIAQLLTSNQLKHYIKEQTETEVPDTLPNGLPSWAVGVWSWYSKGNGCEVTFAAVYAGISGNEKLKYKGDYSVHGDTITVNGMDFIMTEGHELYAEDGYRLRRGLTWRWAKVVDEFIVKYIGPNKLDEIHFLFPETGTSYYIKRSCAYWTGSIYKENGNPIGLFCFGDGDSGLKTYNWNQRAFIKPVCTQPFSFVDEY